MKKLILLTSILIMGCAVSESPELMRVSFQIATIELIEREDSVSAEDVRGAVDGFRATVDLDGTIEAEELMSAADRIFGISEAGGSRQVLMSSIAEIAERRLASYNDLSAVSAQADQILTWISDATYLANE